MRPKAILRSLGPIIIGFRVWTLLKPLTDWLLRLVYALKYAVWYNQSDLQRLALRTPNKLGHENRFLLYQSLLEKNHLAEAPIQYLEFGVAEGQTIRWWSSRNTNPRSQFVGFDTFTGLPEDWDGVPTGTFSTSGRIPRIDDPRCSFKVGLFTATLPSFLTAARPPDARLIVHMDADLYSSTLFTLILLAPRMKTGDLIIFDEFAYVTHEFRAYLDFLSATGLRSRVMVAVNFGDVVAFQVE